MAKPVSKKLLKKKKKKGKKSEWEDSEGDDDYGASTKKGPGKFSKKSVYTNEELLTSSYSVLARVCFV